MAFGPAQGVLSNPVILVEVSAGPGALTDVGSVYTKDVAGVTQLFYQPSSGAEQQLTPAGSGTGDVVGPAAATDNAVTRYDGTTGKLIQNSGMLLSDAVEMTGTADGSGKVGTDTLRLASVRAQAIVVG